ncbi:hypothetical protein NDU88_008384 [Pleurodeles waltl]|uniref:Uncharacterized protein n=1 Tax=Pleurodeles waltl TaxID=8319 RepID=A0AAV7SVS2_PLEWA|nr:hypothetical protein NDU88_008384 [Pleurodeles waltl]
MWGSHDAGLCGGLWSDAGVYGGLRVCMWGAPGLYVGGLRSLRVCMWGAPETPGLYVGEPRCGSVWGAPERRRCVWGAPGLYVGGSGLYVGGLRSLRVCMRRRHVMASGPERSDASIHLSAPQSALIRYGL